MEVIKNGQGAPEYYYQNDSIYIDDIFVGGKRRIGSGRDLLVRFRNRVGINQKISGVIAHQETVYVLFAKYGEFAIANPNLPITIEELATLPLVQFFASAQISITSVSLIYLPEIQSDNIHEKFHRPFSGHT